MGILDAKRTDENIPQFTYYDVPFGLDICDAYALPLWFKDEICNYFGACSRDILASGGSWYCAYQLMFDTILSISPAITTQEEFNLVTNIVTFDNDEGCPLLEDALESARRFVEWAHKTYLEKQKDIIKNRDICVLCKISKRLQETDVCMACHKRHFYEGQKIRNQIYRAKKAGVPATLMLGQWMKTLEQYNNMCSYCQKKPYECIDHHVPISAGGGTTEDNCVPSCQGCYQDKHTDNPEAGTHV